MRSPDTGPAPEHLAAIGKPISRASTPPSAWYTSPEWYAREVESIFLREWLCVGREDQIPNVGDYFTIDVAGEPLLVVRDRHDSVRAHINVCRHRGTVVMSGAGNCERFKCPYHGWTYALSGELRGTPGRPYPMQTAEDFSHDAYGLIPVRTEMLEGFLFVTFDPGAASLTTWAGDLPARLRRYRLDQMRCVRRRERDVSCNWKILVENIEGYHVATLHAKHLDASRPPQIWTHDETHGPYEVLRGIGSLQAGDFPPIEGLDADAREPVLHLWVQPNLQIVLTATHMQYRLMLPAGPQKSQWVLYWYFPASTIESDGFAARLAHFLEKTDPVLDEDEEICPRIQRGVSSRHHRPGRYSPQEQIPHSCANYVIAKVLGDPAARPSTVTSTAR